MLATVPQELFDVEAVRRRGLHEFVRRAWHQIDPAVFRDNWHIALMCRYLERLFRGEITKLAVMVPPGSSKSLICQVLWPAWCWIQNPAEKYIFSTFEAKLAWKFAAQNRDLIRSDWFQARWPHVQITRDHALAKERFENGAQGMRLSTGIGGTVTGSHAGILVGDDPNKAQAAMGTSATTLTELLKARDFWMKTLPTRRIRPVRRLLIQQCLHWDDVINHWVRHDPDVTVFCVPMEYDPQHPHLCPDDPRKEKGELLWPDHVTPAEIEDLKRSLGPTDYAAQYQQLPGRIGGEVIKLDWLTNYWKSLRTADISDGVISCDLTFGSKNDAASYVAIGVWARRGSQALRVDQVRGRFSYTETKAAIRAIYRKHRQWCPTIEIENKANGPAILDDLKSEIPGMIPGEPGSANKLARILSKTGYFEAGDVLLPDPAGAQWDGEWVDTGWVGEYQLELNRFTGGPADVADQVDETSQALQRLFQAKSNRFLAAMGQVARGASL